MDASYSIQIYNDTGVSKVCFDAWKKEAADLLDGRFYKIQEFNASYSFNPREVISVIIPGGHTPHMLVGIKKAADSIQAAISHKASFIGSCAGSLVVSSCSIGIGYVVKDKLIKRTNPMNTWAQESGLDLNSALTAAPYYTPATPCGERNANMAVVEVDSSIIGRSTKCFHAYGPCFIMPTKSHNDYRVLDTYITKGNVEENRPAATILYRPKNPAINARLFTGIHPEVSIEALSSVDSRQNIQDDEIVNALCNQLKDAEDQRTEMLRGWFKALNLKLRNS